MCVHSRLWRIARFAAGNADSGANARSHSGPYTDSDPDAHSNPYANSYTNSAPYTDANSDSARRDRDQSRCIDDAGEPNL